MDLSIQMKTRVVGVDISLERTTSALRGCQRHVVYSSEINTRDYPGIEGSQLLHFVDAIIQLDWRITCGLDRR